LRVRIQLQDILALVVGYGMAALLFRAFWPASGLSAPLGLPVLCVYLWVGLAMSGPVILLWHRRRTGQATGDENRPGPSAERTWAESAWILIGCYWVILGLFVIPVRWHEFKVGDAVLFGVLPIVAPLCLRFLGPGAGPARHEATAWTHTAAIGLLATWPIAWICLIVLGQSLR
jgi:hypothetical protein